MTNHVPDLEPHYETKSRNKVCFFVETGYVSGYADGYCRWVLRQNYSLINLTGNGECNNGECNKPNPILLKQTLFLVTPMDIEIKVFLDQSDRQW